MIKWFPEKSIFNQFVVTISLIVIFAVLLYQASAQEQDASKPSAKKESEEIHILSEKLVIDQTANTAEFIGNVKATQGATHINSDRLKIFYKKGIEGTPDKTKTNEDTLEKVVAEGNVEINFDNGLAVTPHAVYNTNEKVLVLTGKGTKLIKGKDTISGNKIVFNRQNGQLQVEGRVKANIFSEEKVLN